MGTEMVRAHKHINLGPVPDDVLTCGIAWDDEFLSADEIAAMRRKLDEVGRQIERDEKRFQRREDEYRRHNLKVVAREIRAAVRQQEREDRLAQEFRHIEAERAERERNLQACIDFCQRVYLKLVNLSTQPN
jgi:seryl-tRNA synthetase